MQNTRKSYQQKRQATLRRLKQQMNRKTSTFQDLIDENKVSEKYMEYVEKFNDITTQIYQIRIFKLQEKDIILITNKNENAQNKINRIKDLFFQQIISILCQVKRQAELIDIMNNSKDIPQRSKSKEQLNQAYHIYNQSLLLFQQNVILNIAEYKAIDYLVKYSIIQYVNQEKEKHIYQKEDGILFQKKFPIL